jgi:putative transposase
MYDQWQDGRSFLLFNLIDDSSPEALAIGIDQSLPPARLFRALKQVIAWRSKHSVISCDNGSEYVRMQIRDSAKTCGIEMEFILP